MNLRIVKGNNFYLMVKVTDKRGGASTAVNLSSVSALSINLLYQRDGLIRKRSVEPNVMTTNSAVAIIKCENLMEGDYGVELSYKKNSYLYCARELGCFSIVYSNKDANMPKTEYEAEQTTGINLSVQIYGIPESSSGGGGGDTPIPTGNCYYGVITNMPYAVSTLDGLTKKNLSSLSKTAVNYTEGQSVVILIPASSSLKGYQDNGFGQKVAFNEQESGVQVGCNGQTVTISGTQYKVYGQLFLNTGTCFIYIN